MNDLLKFGMGFGVAIVLLLPVAMYTNIHELGDHTLPDKIDDHIIKSHSIKGLTFSYLVIFSLVIIALTGASALGQKTVWWLGVFILVGVVGTLFIMFKNQFIEQSVPGRWLKSHGWQPGRIAAGISWISLLVYIFYLFIKYIRKGGNNSGTKVT